MYISIDIGGTHMRIALLDASGQAEIVKQESFMVPQDFKVGLQCLIEHIAEIGSDENVQGIGACFPGIVDKNDMLTTANNLSDWTGKPIKNILQERFQVPVKLMHDAQASALGEALFGAASGSDRFVYLVWGTGIGAADVKKIDDHQYFMFSFENGHYIMDWEGKLCTCGQHGCPEVYLGGDRLREYFNTDMADVTDGDPRWDFVIEKAAQVFLNTLIFHPVDLFVFSGGVITHRPFLLERIRLIMEKRLKMFPLPSMVLAEKGVDSALYGCMGAFLVEII